MPVGSVHPNIALWHVLAQLARMPVQVGALYAIYTLVETQPGVAKVLPYIPVGTLGALLSLVRRAPQERLPDVPAIAQRLVRRGAFAVGALCRPPPPPAQPRVAGPPRAPPNNCFCLRPRGPPTAAYAHCARSTNRRICMPANQPGVGAARVQCQQAASPHSP